jgi:hypothetical protein
MQAPAGASPAKAGSGESFRHDGKAIGAAGQLGVAQRIAVHRRDIGRGRRDGGDHGLGQDSSDAPGAAVPIRRRAAVPRGRRCASASSK